MTFVPHERNFGTDSGNARLRITKNIQTQFEILREKYIDGKDYRF